MATNFMRVLPQSHARKVCNLYKRACREIEANIFMRRHAFLEVRYQQVLLRDRFEKNRGLDADSAKRLLEDGEKELYIYSHPLPKQFTNSPGGINYGRHPPDPDWILDSWHPLEKAQYPEYFARRDVRKREFIERKQKEHIENEKELERLQQLQLKGDS